MYHMWSPMARKLKRLFNILFHFISYTRGKFVFNPWSIDIYGVYSQANGEGMDGAIVVFDISLSVGDLQKY